MRASFGEFELDGPLRELRRAGARVSVQPKVLDLLLFLIANRHRVVTREEIRAAIWPDAVVTPASVARALKGARRALGDDGREQRWLRTHHGGGLRFVGELAIDGEVGGARSPGDRPYVGRADLLARLRAEVESASESRGRVLLLAGEPGVGKTRTAREMLTWARARGFTTQTAFAMDADVAPPHWPWPRLLRALAASVPARDAATLVELASSLEGAGESVPSPDASSGVIVAPALPFFERVWEAIERIARRAPVALVLEDLHEAAAGAISLLGFVAAEIARTPLLVVATYRPWDLARRPAAARALARLVRHPTVSEREIGPLSAHEVGELVRAHTGAEAPAALAEALWERAAGNPLFVEEILHAGLADVIAASERADPGWEASLPESARRAIEGRLSVLAPRTRAWLRRAAILGDELDVSLLSRVGAPETGADEALEEASLTRIVDAVAGAPGRWRFAHPIVREVARDELGAIERAQLHHRVALVLEELHRTEIDAHVDALAAHWLAAGSIGDPGRAIERALQAGAHAESAGAFDRAATLYESAAALIGPGIGDDTALEIWLALARARERLADRGGAREAAACALALARTAGDGERRARAALRFAGPMTDHRLPDDATVSALEGALSAAPRPATHARLLARLAAEHAFSADRARHDAYRRAAAEAAFAAADPLAIAEVVDTPFAGIWERMEPDARLRLAERCIDGARRAVDTGLTLRGELLLANELLARGELARLELLLDEIEPRARREGHLHAAYLAGLHRGTLALARGQLEAAESLAHRAHEIVRRADVGAPAVFLALQIAVIRLAQGRAGELTGAIAADARARPGPQSPCLLAWALAVAGDVSGAGLALDAVEHDHLARLTHFPMQVANAAILARAYAFLGRRPPSSVLEEILRPSRGRVALRGIVTAHGPVGHALGLLAFLRGDAAEGRSLLAEAERWATAAGAAGWALEPRRALEAPPVPSPPVSG